MVTLEVPSFVVITGASRGIGRAIAIQLAGKIHSDSLMILTARSLQELEETALIIKRDANENLHVRCIAADLWDEESVASLSKTLFEDLGDVTRFDHAILIHNAGSIGTIEKFAWELSDINLIQKHCLLNLTAPIVLTSAFLEMFEKAKAGIRKTIVQVTSMAATYPLKKTHLYGMTKAGRDMFFRVMAREDPSIRILAYDPGLVETVMFTELKNSKDADLRGIAEHVTAQSYVLSPEQTAGTLMKILQEDKYESGATVRCYEVMNIDISDVVRLLNTK